ncbi:hypothetical protein EVAR_78193_1 [Eumeta japonica]|uniref:Uncharacterized protein n=1 Tax=Eumeta variegata TaxID=151549 RepID=A0A4C1UYQ1_EUMVA|nr:hypothetical protein EVAR_78193_1 [Eumeta japonica]
MIIRVFSATGAQIAAHRIDLCKRGRDVVGRHRLRRRSPAAPRRIIIYPYEWMGHDLERAARCGRTLRRRSELLNDAVGVEPPPPPLAEPVPGLAASSMRRTYRTVLIGNLHMHAVFTTYTAYKYAGGASITAGGDLVSDYVLTSDAARGAVRRASAVARPTVSAPLNLLIIKKRAGRIPFSSFLVTG